MNVLFVGGWDLAGSSIAGRLIREGNKVCWVTEEQRRDLWSDHLKGTVYRGVKGKEEYLHILKADAIDTVVYLTGARREDYEARNQYESHLHDLTDILSALQIHKVEKFVYLSSIETDYLQKLTPSLAELTAGEEFCNAYRDSYGVPVLVVKFGCVYGDTKLEDMGFIGSILESMRAGKKLVNPYSEEACLDVIYGEDLAVAVKLLLELQKSGTYRVLTGQRLRMQELYQTLSEITGRHVSVSWTRERKTAEESYFTENTEVKLETGWMPFYVLEGKGKKVLKQIYESEKNRDNTEEKPQNSFLKKVIGLRKTSTFYAIAETLLLFVVISFLLRFQKDVNDIKYVDIRLLYVALIAAVHGTGMGIIAIVLAISSYVYSLIAANVDPSYLLYSVDTWIPLVIYTVAGVVIGYITDRRLDEQEIADEQYRLLNEKHEFLKLLHGTTLEVKNNLQHQIVTSKLSFGRIYDVIVELDVLKPDLILLKVINILELIMECDKAAVYLFTGDNLQYARLKACSQHLRESASSSLKMETIPMVIEAFRKEDIFVNKTLRTEYPDYAAPIYFQGKLYGFVALVQIPTERFTIYYQNLLKIVTRLIERQLVKALEYEISNQKDLFYPGTHLLYPEAFEERLEIFRSSKDYAFYTYVYGKVYPQEQMEQSEAAAKIQSVIRGSDCVGIDKDGDYAVILLNAVSEQMNPVRERFEKKGFRLEVE